MNPEALEELSRFANERHVSIVDDWQRSRATADVDGLTDDECDELRDRAATDGLAVSVLVGSERRHVRFGPEQPDDDEITSVARLLSHHEPGVARAAASGFELVALAGNQIEGVEIAVSDACWVRTPEAFAEACADQWWRITRALRDCRELVIGDVLFPIDTTEIGDATLTLPREGADGPVAKQLWRLADAESWMHIAVQGKVEHGQALVALHYDQPTETPVQLNDVLVFRLVNN